MVLEVCASGAVQERLALRAEVPLGHIPAQAERLEADDGQQPVGLGPGEVVLQEPGCRLLGGEIQRGDSQPRVRVVDRPGSVEPHLHVVTPIEHAGGPSEVVFHQAEGEYAGQLVCRTCAPV